MFALGSSRTVMKHWHTFLPEPIKPGTHVLDLGANIGHFSTEMTRHFDCTSHAVEPDPLLIAKIAENPRIHRYPCAVVAASLAGSTLRFQRSANALAGRVTSEAEGDSDTSFPVQTRSLEEIIAGVPGPISLVKMDIEGVEIEILDTLPESLLRTIPQLTVEFHDFMDLTPPEVVLRTAQRLESLGFAYLRMSGIGHQDTLFVNRRLLSFGRSDKLVTQYVTRNVRGFRRVARRALGLPPKC